MNEQDADFVFTFEFSTAAFACKCGETVEPGTKILFLNDNQQFLCNECIRSYLKQLVADLEYTDDTYTIIDNTTLDES